ncbi:hypothetical protein EK904_000847 [Melospiza melodia maxima]|nr:hypothetical protein EK904_000847 [Melospiza melodia maxima]
MWHELYRRYRRLHGDSYAVTNCTLKPRGSCSSPCYGTESTAITHLSAVGKLWQRDGVSKPCTESQGTALYLGVPCSVLPLSAHPGGPVAQQAAGSTHTNGKSIPSPALGEKGSGSAGCGTSLGAGLCGATRGAVGVLGSNVVPLDQSKGTAVQCSETFGFDISGLTSLGPLRSTPTSQVREREAPVFSTSKQCVLKQVGSKSKPRVFWRTAMRYSHDWALQRFGPERRARELGEGPSSPTPHGAWTLF